MDQNQKPRRVRDTYRSDKGKKRVISPEGLANLRKPNLNKLRALRKTGVPRNKILNPHGRAGVEGREDKDAIVGPAWKPEKIRRKREKLKWERERALEMHELQELARQSARGALETLVEISGNKRAPEAARIAASVSVLDRGYGKASNTTITANVSNGKAADLTGDELDRRVKQALKRVEDLTRRTPQKAEGPRKPSDLRKLN